MAVYMVIFSGEVEKKKILIRGPVTRNPYKGWIELDSVQLGASQQNSGTSLDRESKMALSTDVTVMTSFLDLSVFAISPVAGTFNVQLDFVGDDGKAKFSVVMRDCMISGLTTGGTPGSARPPSVSAVINATQITYIYEGTAKSNSPSYTLKRL